MASERARRQLARAIEIGERLLAERQRILGPDHDNTLTSKNNLALAYNRAGRTSEAITLREQSLTARERILGRDHLDTLNSRRSLIHSYRVAGRRDEARGLES